MDVYEESALRLVKIGPLGPLANNSYLIQDRESGDTLIIDAPADGERVLEPEALAGGRIIRIAVTHRHPDHWASIDTLKAATGAPVVCHEADREPYATKVDAAIADGELIEVGSVVGGLMRPPAQHPGGIGCLAGRHLIRGAPSSRGGPGRTNRPEDREEEIRAIPSRLFELPDETAVHPGHGDDGNIGESKREHAGFAAREHPASLSGDVTWADS